MNQDRINAMVTRITPFVAVDLDGILSAHDPRARRDGKDIFPETTAKPVFHTIFRDQDTVTIGVRIDKPRSDLAVLAGQLSSLSMERDAEVIVLSEIDYSGLERFGFRCERICGDTPAARDICLRQITRFWNLEIVI